MPELNRTDSTQRAIFLSYASQDSAAAKAIFEALTLAGFEVWFDQSELRGGDAWDQKIRRQIKECSLFLPIISAHTQTRAEGYFRLEWHLAEQRTYLMAQDQCFLMPVVVDETPDSAARVPEKFRERQWTRLQGGVTTPEFAERIGRLLSGAAEARQRNNVGIAQPAFAVPASPSKERSVAVLPFSNLSGDRENEYFSDGVSEELLTVLQKVPGVRVAARTSAFSFKGKNATAQEIGTKLGVAQLIEGSVQKSGSRVKVTARLSRVATGEENWSRSYTRELNDVFALQEELALAIVAELRGHFEGPDSAGASLVRAASKGGTKNPEAYQEYLMGRHQVNQFSSEAEVKALRHFIRATELDPGYANAWASLSQTHSWFCGYEGSLTRAQFDEHLSKARVAAQKALALEPDLALGLAASFWIQCGFDFDFKAGAATAKRALELAPSDPEVVVMASRMAIVTGELAAALELARRSVELDPISARTRVQLTLNCLANGLFEEAKVEAAKTAELNPNSMFAKSGLGFVHLCQGQYPEAEQAVAGAPDEWHALWIRSIAYFAQNKLSAADGAIAQLIDGNGDTAAAQIASVFAFRGENDKAFEWLERARKQRDPGLASLNASPFFDKVRGDPRWVPFWESIGFSAKALSSPGTRPQPS